MKKENILIIILAVIAFLSIMIYNNRYSQKGFSNSSIEMDIDNSIEWKTFEQGFQIAKEQDKPIFLYFYADWCSFCIKLKKTTFKDKAVLAYLKQNFISIKVNTDIHRELSTEWKVRALPTTWFLEPDATKINAISGYFDETKFLNILEYIHTKSYKKMSLKKFIETI